MNRTFRTHLLAAFASGALACGDGGLELDTSVSEEGFEEGCEPIDDCAGRDGVRVPFAERTWEEGAYRFEVTMEGTTVTCEKSIPFVAVEVCDGPGVYLAVGVSAGAAYFSEVVLPADTTGSVELAVFLDDVELVREGWDVTLVTEVYGSVGCEQTCTGWVAPPLVF